MDNDEIQNDDVELSDVIEVIQTDTDFRVPTEEAQNREMFNGGGEILVPRQTTTSSQVSQQSRRQQAHIKIVEQPAPKALRFRYECEGRSAGSIPGANSTPENKTYPTIQIVGYQGKAVVVVSCVTKDPPHRPHPHNLVGREGCKRGVCTLEIPVDTMTVQFSNLGIQCVKKKDIEHALRVREEIRVDPFRTGFSHRNQPTSIDLNTVRLCFQVFLEGDTPGKFTVPLKPVVSEPIYDKKAMSDLSIIKLSDCVSYVDGGKKDIILLCEKVAKEDIQVRFYEENSDWEAFADFQPSQVHKQHAIWFRTPRYKTLDVSEPVKVLIQLRRPSDGATSESLPFELWPSYLLDSGRHWSLRRNLAKKGNYNLFNSILANDAKLLLKRQLGGGGGGENEEKIAKIGWKETLLPPEKDVCADLSSADETNNNQIDAKDNELDYSVVKKASTVVEEKSFNELINQVAELDEIYCETQARLLQQDTLKDIAEPLETFDDGKTYSSLQLAFKNPVEIDLTQYDAPVPEASGTSNKRESDAEKPPLPPKRTKKVETFIGGSMTSVNKVDLRGSSSSVRTATVSCGGSLARPTSQLELAPSKHLPPTPNYSTLPNPKKRGFFSKLFGRGRNKSASSSREASLTPSGRTSMFSSSKSLQVASGLDKSTKSLQVAGLGKSSGNISTHSSNSVRIPLKDDSPTAGAEADLAISDQVVDVTGDVDMNLDLTEAEHYALYTALAPHATQSEFDEMSCYYAPVEGGKLLTNAEVLARLASKT